MWIDVFSEKWICFGCNGLALKHGPFCHHACSYTKKDNDHFNNNDINIAIAKFISCKDLVWLSANKVIQTFGAFPILLEVYLQNTPSL